MYTILLGKLRTGEITTVLPVSAASWTLALNGAGSMQATAQLSDPAIAALDLYRQADPARTFMAIETTDTDGTARMLGAGPIWKHDWDDDAQQLQIAAAGLWSYFDHRFVLPVLTAGTSPAGHPSTWSSLSLRTIAKRLVQQAQLATAGDLPIVFESDASGGNTRTYQGYALKTVGAALDDLTKVNDGPDIEFRPRRKGSDPRYVEWVMLTGDPMLQQAGDDWRWDTSPAESPVSKIKVSRDGTGIASRAFVQGSGQESDAMFGAEDDTTLTAAGFPFMETADTTHTSVTEQATLDGYATELLALSQRAVQSWSCTVQSDHHPVLGTYHPGDWARIIIGEDDPYLPAGAHRARIIQISGALDDAVNLQFQTSAGVPHD